jgi:capsid protein
LIVKISGTMAITKKSFTQRIESAWKSLFNEGEEVVAQQRAVESSFGGTYRPLFAIGYDGEKNLGEMGPIRAYFMDYPALRLRAWQAYIESAEAQIIINKYCTWVVGKGLKLQAEPVKPIVSPVNSDIKKFSDSVEARFAVFAKSNMCDIAGQKNLGGIANDCFKNATNSGDVLVVLRYINGCVKIQLIDGGHVMSPIYGSEIFNNVLSNGNRLINGIEISPQGEHVAYHVRKGYDASMTMSMSLEFERIPAKGRASGMTTAFMVYGLKYRLDNFRGIPLISVVLEKMKKLERYESATLASAEEQAKIAYQVVHELGSTGEFPMARQVATAHDIDGYSDLPATDDGTQLANKVAASTNKTAVNNPPGAEIKTLRQTESTLYFKDFYGVQFDIICSCVEMPPNVATSKYDSNYSASRAAIKDWEHTLDVKRTDFSFQFYQKVYNFWLEIEILKNNISAPGYLLARQVEDNIMLEAYRNARFVGAPVANIDPMKEVQAERLKLGLTGASIPLTTVEAATEVLNGGDHDHNMEQYGEELQKSKDLGIIPMPEVTQTDTVSE